MVAITWTEWNQSRGTTGMIQRNTHLVERLVLLTWPERRYVGSDGFDDLSASSGHSTPLSNTLPTSSNIGWQKD